MYVLERLNIANLLISQLGGKATDKTIDIIKEVKRLVPNIDKDFIDLYFDVKKGMHHYEVERSGKEDVQISGKDIGEALIELAKLQLSGKLTTDNKIIKNVTDGLNYKSQKAKTANQLLNQTKVFNRLFAKRQKKKGSDYTVQKFSHYIIMLLLKIFDAEYEVISKLQK
jgi:hypothetical protein